ncbi:hypothetical protein KTT_03900 [Tengunoibacter tsumagoiensis]|uniref:Uncharacterized protein n=2 Tax=Tengunoibacter tsumagoiensis TaxID=2014871 RepID=A0A401ZUG8_9CHLR|nr:hypothetical protein KTT_03900 [Tengunoibacter tsumagoiensis]
MLKNCGGVLLFDVWRLGVISYDKSHVWVSLGNVEKVDKKSIIEAEKMLQAPVLSTVGLLTSCHDPQITYQMAYDFAYLCIQHYHCVLDDGMDEIDDQEVITAIYQERRFTDRVPPLVEKPGV